MTQAIRAKGNVALYFNTGASSSPTWALVPGIISNGGGGNSLEQIDATSFDSPGNSRELIAGLTAPVARTYELNYKPGNTVVAAIRALNISGELGEFKLEIGGATAYTEEVEFEALVTNFGDPTGPVDGKLSAPFELLPTTAEDFAEAV